MTTQPEALRLSLRLEQLANLEANELAEVMDSAATELRRLHAENETLRTQHLGAHKCTSAIFGALTQISILTDLGGEVAEYDDVVQAVRRLHEVNEELMKAATKTIDENRHLADGDNCTLIHLVRAIAKAAGETK